MMKLLPQHTKAVNSILPVLKDAGFYLAGGTAVYYHLHHRESYDLDFFTPSKKNLLEYQSYLPPERTRYLSEDTIHTEIEGIEMSFFLYPYKLLNALEEISPIYMASLEDILCMKLNAIVGRGSRKDFIDVYFIMSEKNISPGAGIDLFEKKFGSYNPLILRKALTYFEDADNEPELNMIKPVEWQKIKKFFQKSFTKL